MTRKKIVFENENVFFLSKILDVDHYDLQLQYIQKQDPVTFRTPDFNVCRTWWDFLRSHLPSHGSDKITRGLQIEKCIAENTYL